MSYPRERLFVFPWVVTPAMIYYLGHARGAAIDAPLFGFVFVFVLFMRALDDYACFGYDQMCGKARPHLGRRREDLLRSVIPLGVASALVCYSAMPREQFALTAIFVALHGPIYFVLSKRGAVLAISLSKYPFLFYLVALRTGQEEWWWPALGSV